MPGQQPAHLGEDLLRNLDERQGLVLESGPILRDRLLLGLPLIV